LPNSGFDHFFDFAQGCGGGCGFPRANVEESALRLAITKPSAIAKVGEQGAGGVSGGHRPNPVMRLRTGGINGAQAAALSP
jgi:hypothetical protein